MKKRSLYVIILCVLVLFSACRRSSVVQNIGPVLDNYRYEEPKEIHEIEFSSASTADFKDSLGFTMTGMPENLIPAAYFVIDDWYAQIQFGTDSTNARLMRVANIDNFGLRNTFDSSHSLESRELTIDNITAFVGENSDGHTLVIWERGEYQYALQSRVGLDDATIEDAVENTRAEGV